MRSLASVLAIALMTIACAGSKGTLRMEKLDYPVSSSGYIYNKDLQPIRIGKGLTKVSSLESSQRFWSILYAQVPLSSDDALFGDFNAQIKETQGIGVVNFEIENSACALNQFYILTILPFWPGCTVVRFRGEAVALSR